MAAQEPEVLLAQRLACNEKTVRNKAMKRLRKYISARSQGAAGGFTGDELLKLWKGLFYCLWMQDKPLLQEELSNQISSLIHNFHDTDKQLMFLQSFLQTFKREWTGIDRLRMDKFYQLVRFMFRQTFDVLKRRSWESSAVEKFLELLKCDLLQNDSQAPSGLLLHILDLYMAELAAVGAAELTADQNLTLIEPFCRKAAKTKNQTLFSAICKSFFSAIIDQAPFALEDLMKEVKSAEDSDSGQESEGGDEKTAVQNRSERRINGTHLTAEDESDDELLDSEDSADEDLGPVLQFDYAALADKLFQLASRSSTPGHNRQKLYRIVKVLRDLSEGVFPQDEHPDEVSTDEDDDMFGSRKRMKRAARKEDVEDEGKPAGKRSKAGSGEKLEALDIQSDKKEPVHNEKKRKKKKKAKNQEGGTDLNSAGRSEGSVKQSPGSDLEAPSETSQVKEEDHKDEAVGTDREEQQLTTEEPGKKKKKKKKSQRAETETSPVSREASGEECPLTAELSAAAAGRNQEKQEKSETKLTSDLPGMDVNVTDDQPGEEPTAASAKKHKKKIQRREEEQKDAAEIPSGRQQKKITKKKDKQEVDADQNQEAVPATPVRRKKSLKGGKTTGHPQINAGQMKQTQDQPDQRTEAGDSSSGPERPLEEADAIRSSEKAAKAKKRKIPVEFEFEADESEESTTAGSVTEAKTIQQKNDVREPKSLKTSNQNISRAFLSFQRRAAVPTPLYCKTNGSPRTPASCKKRLMTPKSESKKVTFGLKNNKTAEFKKSDRSLLLSPEGLSRVPFDPQQKPKFGVLKSPPTAVKKTPKGAKKTPQSLKKKKKTPIPSKKAAPTSLPNTPKRRPSAADFF